MSADPNKALDAEADAFAQLLALSGNPDQAFRDAAALARGLFRIRSKALRFCSAGGARSSPTIWASASPARRSSRSGTSLPHGPFLIVCPASVKRNWAREIEIAAPGASTHVIERGAELTAEHEWVIVNYDVLNKHIATLGGIPWSGLVFDEAHYLKNHRSARSRLARQLADRAKAQAGAQPAVYLLTGTPLTNRPRDLFVLLQLVGHPLGRSFLSFAKRYCAAERNDYGWETRGASNIEELTVQLHGVMLRRSKDRRPGAAAEDSDVAAGRSAEGHWRPRHEESRRAAGR